MEEECSPTSSNITPDREFIKHSTLSLVCLLLSASPAVGSAEMVEERFRTLIFMFTVQYPIIPRCIEAAIYQCMCLTVIVDFFFCVQRAPPHQIGDAALPRSDPNLSAPDKGKTLH